MNFLLWALVDRRITAQVSVDREGSRLKAVQPEDYLALSGLAFPGDSVTQGVALGCRI